MDPHLCHCHRSCPEELFPDRIVLHSVAVGVSTTLLEGRGGLVMFLATVLQTQRSLNFSVKMAGS